VADTALLIIDLQQGLFKKKIKIFKEEELIKNINFLIEKSRKLNIPVIFIRHTNKSFLAENSEDWQIHPDVEFEEADLFLNKKHSSLFKEKSIIKKFEDMGLKSLIIAGLVTHGCVKAACLDGKKFGYEIKLAADAHSSFNEKAEKLIEEWNENLSQQGIIVLPAAEIFL